MNTNEKQLISSEIFYVMKIKIGFIVLIIGSIFLFNFMWFNISTAYTNEKTNKLSLRIDSLITTCDSLENIVTNYQTKCDTIIVNISPQPLKIYQHVDMSIDSSYLYRINYRNE